MRTNLIKKFKDAALHLELLTEPIRSNLNDDIVQMDVGRNLSRRKEIGYRKEFFRIWPGHKDNRIQVRDVDKKHKQLVLLVNEPMREFEERISKKGKTWTRNGAQPITRGSIKAELGKGERIIRENKGEFVVMRRTPSDTRYFLMGVDERQLFIAQTADPVTTVDQARKSLGKTVLTADGTRKGSALDRQGEWFFWETDRKTRNAIDELIHMNRLPIKRKTNIGIHAGRSGGNPHIAEELVTTPPLSKLNHGFGVRPSSVYVRGKVSHVDHKTVKFTHWREVVANNEGATARATASGVLWVD